MGQLAVSKIQNIQDWLTSEKMTKSLAVAIRMPGVTPEQIVRIALAAVQRDNKLAECTPVSICSAVVTACQLGLEPDNVTGLAYLVPYGKTCTLIPGYRGLVQLAYRSGQVGSFETRVVYERDDCVVDWGAEPPIRHTPTSREDRGEMQAVYAKVRLNTGGTIWEWMWNHEIDAVRDHYSPSAKSSHSPWKTDYIAMARKTVARRACKWVPSSPQLQRAVSLGDQAEIGIPQDLEPIDVTPTDSALVDDMAAVRERLTKTPDAEPAPQAESPSFQELVTPVAPPPPETDDKPIGLKSDLFVKIRDAFNDLPQNKREEVRRHLKELGANIITDIAKWTSHDADNAMIAIQDAATVKK